MMSKFFKTLLAAAVVAGTFSQGAVAAEVAGVKYDDTMKVAGDTMLPLVLAGLSGVFFSVSEICPYKPEKNAQP